MSRARRAGIASVAVVALALTGSVGGVAGAQGAQAKPGKGDRAVTERLAMAAGLQVGPKHDTRPTVRIGGASYLAANPYLAQLREDKGVDWSYWRRRLAAAGGKSASSPQARSSLIAPKVAVPTPYTYDEQEPAGQRGANDTQAELRAAQRVRRQPRPAGRRGRRGAVAAGGRDHRADHPRGPGLDPQGDRHRDPQPSSGRHRRAAGSATAPTGAAAGGTATATSTSSRCTPSPARRSGPTPSAAGSTPCSWSTRPTARSSTPTTTSGSPRSPAR